MTVTWSQGGKAEAPLHTLREASVTPQVLGLREDFITQCQGEGCRGLSMLWREARGSGAEGRVDDPLGHLEELWVVRRSLCMFWIPCFQQ